MMVEEKQLLYLYCVTDREPELKQTGALENDVSCVRWAGLCAVVCTVDEHEFGVEGLGKNMADFHWAKSKAIAHEKVIEQIMGGTNVIPFRFGTLFDTKTSLVAMLQQYGDEFKAILAKLTEKHEWGLKVYCDRERLKAVLPGDYGDIPKLEDEIRTSSVGRAYFLKKKKEALTETALSNRIDECGRISFDLLKRSSVEARANRLLPREVTEREHDMVLNAAFLVDTRVTDEFLDTVNKLRTRYEHQGFLIECTGPWPPYNFCCLSAVQ